jgi:hypothetical protein
MSCRELLAAMDPELDIDARKRLLASMQSRGATSTYRRISRFTGPLPECPYQSRYKWLIHEYLI